MKLELKVEQANSSSDDEDLDISQSSTEIVLNRKVSQHSNAHVVVEVKVYLFAEHNNFFVYL